MIYPAVDVHAHMDHALFKDNLPEVLKRAEEAGIKAIISNGTNRISNQNVLDLAKKFPIIKPALGFYPIDLLGLGPDEAGMPKQEGPIDINEELAWIKKHKDEAVAIGEVGMDFHWDKDQHKLQEEQFTQIIQFAKALKKPLIIHSRKAEQRVIELLEQEDYNKAIMHCFCGKKKLIQKGAQQGLSFSVPANINRAQNFQMLVQEVPIHQLFTETDAPYLGPNKDELNESANIQQTIKHIARIKQLDEKEAALLLYKNYQDLF